MRKRLPGTIPPEQWDKLISIVRNDPDRVNAFLNGFSPDSENEKTVEHKSNGPISVEELAFLFQIDLNIFECAHFQPNVWNIGAKYRHADGTIEILTAPLYQSKAVFRRKKEDHVARVLEMIREAREPMLQPVRILNDGPDRKLAVELCLFDFHVGKEAMDDDWSMETMRKVWWDAINHLLEDVPLHKVDRWVLPTGNDFLHVDNSKGMTYAGTPVGSGSKWFRNLMFGKELVCEAIQMLSQYAPVVVPMIQGNHDKDSVMALGEMISERFRGRDDVMIMNNGNTRVYWRYGTNLIGFGHGDLVKAEKIAQLMPMEVPQDYAATTYRAFHLGHLHMRRELAPITNLSEHYCIDVVHCPSLSPKDVWHHDSGFIGSMRRSQSFIYDAEKGLLGSRFFQLKK